MVEAVEGPMGEGGETSGGDWLPSEHRPDFLWAALAEQMAAALGEIAVADVCREAVRRSIERELPEDLDFQI